MTYLANLLNNDSQLDDAIYKAGNKITYDSDDMVKYFCGICWNIIKEKGRS